MNQNLKITTKKMKNNKVVLGLSGGVDSSAAACILKEAGAEQIFLEYEHGDSKIKRQQQMMFEKAQPGDTIITLEVREG